MPNKFLTQKQVDRVMSPVWRKCLKQAKQQLKAQSTSKALESSNTPAAQ